MRATPAHLTSREVHLVTYPDGAVAPGDFALVEVDVPATGAGELLVRNTWTSVDPGLRLRLRPAAPSGYFSAFPLNRSLDGILSVGEVVESRADGFGVGDLVWHASGWREYSVVNPAVEQLGGLGTVTRLDRGNVQPQWYLGPLGGMGLTAYAGLAVTGALRGGGTVWVSAAAGAVGSLAVQIAALCGNVVVASAGSDDKVAWLTEELGAAAAFDYRAEPAGRALRRVAPDGIDVYFDSVGGDHLEAALDALRPGGRVALCGSISDYEAETAGPRNLFLATAKNLTLHGFRGSSNLHLLAEVQERLGAWLGDGRLVWRETVYEGLDSAPQALIDMLSGKTTGKTLVKIAW